MTLSAPARRTVLGAAAASGAAVLLGGCGGDSDGASGSSPSAALESTESETEAEPEDGASAPAASQPAAGSGDALAKTADVPVGGGAVLQGPKVVVTQPAAGQFKAFTAVCTHQACLVGSVADNVIMCPCHGSRYSAEDGSVQQGPATAPLDEVAVTVQGDSVVRA